MVWWNSLQLFTLKMLLLPRRSDWKPDRTICTNMVTFPSSLVLWAEAWHTQLSWTCYAISGMPLWPQSLVWHTHAGRDWCHKASLCQHLREALEDCPFGFVFWENDLLPGASRADISRQQEPSAGVLWRLWTEACPQTDTELCSLQPLHGPERLLAKTGTATKRGQSTQPSKSFGLACAGTSVTLEGVERAAADADTGQFTWTLAAWRDPLWQSASGPNVSSLGPFNCKSYLWTVFPLGAEQNSFNPSCSLPFFLFQIDFQKKYVFCN